MTAHPLDRPVWSALTNRQADLALGDTHALRMDPDYGLFAAAADRTRQSLAALGALTPASGALALVEADRPPRVPGTRCELRYIWQMTAEALRPHAASRPDFEIVPLTEDDAPQMLALATLTEPGPFFSRTHRLGDFIGVKARGQLLAMAGERMKPVGFTEISGVCTHPNHRGYGYAAALTYLATQRVLERGEQPFLHVYAHNKAAIALYEALGFSLRREMAMAVLTRA
ncbi:GNAT family N-acetyltransferase [Phenylobacterium sp.]|uniref:GNAT family N-acetyltransferase n=1 Tax=Phenylobacterium sp. TaxID=1871053 RepID=UPI0011F7D485|nr:GNAT family N-acetyltransferase [Phenylobacterium sp.]THD58621.1 MAG: GNAT family N-acetyltransferase [Phenylobacterium sp.]